MTALGLLSAIRRANLHDDEARILLAIAAGVRRWSDIRDTTGLKEFQLFKMAKSLAAQGWIDVEEVPAGTLGRGKCSVYSLTSDGASKVRELFPVDESAVKTLRPLPIGVAISLPVKAGLCFLES